MSQQSGFGPLQGVKVLELGHVMAGPVCGMMLADMGAEVIKLEKIAGGDDSRRMVPPRIKDESAAFLILNRNKRGIAVDLKFPQGIEIVKRLIGRTDILIENFRLGTMERLGLGYEDAQKLNPGLIYCSLSGFGRTGPYAARGGYQNCSYRFLANTPFLRTETVFIQNSCNSLNSSSQHGHHHRA
jgi:crotonobetainyl-CoA:carnitine CoA-transferase CaiB-like acyl-CoA transferase